MSFTTLLEYESKLFLELMEEDGLLITAKGLGLDRLLLKVIHTFCKPENLVLVLNTLSEEQFFFINELNFLGVKDLPKVITAENTSSEREKLYLSGGVFFITSRILVVDMLTKRIPIDYITGILVHRAHKIGESSQEAFILRMFRENNNAGFIKGFSDTPTAFMSGYCQVERVMKQLFVRKLFLRPRFHADVVDCLEKHKPDVVELSVEPTPLMSGIQMAILDLIESSLRELKRSTPMLDQDELTLENSLTKYFDRMLKSQLDPHWNRLSNKAKQLVSDVKILRVLLSYLTQYDCVTFYNFLQSLRANETNKTNQQSLWMFMDAANTLFLNAKARLYGSTKMTKAGKTYTDGELEASPKWEAVTQILEEIEQESKETDAGKVLICASDERTCFQLRQILCNGSENMLKELLTNSLQPREEDEILKKGKKEKNGLSKKRKATECVQTDRNDKIKLLRVDNDEDEFALKILPNSLVVIHPLSGCNDPYSLLRKLYELQPKYVILYDAEMDFVRQLEVFKASRPGISLRVYFMFYNGSVEEQRYLTTLRKEKDAFELLIRQKADMIIPEERHGKSDVARSLIRDAGKANEVVDTRKSGGRVPDCNLSKTIVVDMREFRSELPSLIHKRGIDIEPVTLEVGDYILTPDICVERKSISDLIGSLNNGRLYTQCVAMTRFYKRPILLIEFDESKSFSLQSTKSLRNEVSLNNISSKLTLLTIHFPELRIIWSQSPHLTSEIFEDLKANCAEPDAKVAMGKGVDQEGPINNILFNMVPLDVVQKFPGVNSKNYRLIMNKYTCLKDFVNQTEASVGETIENKSNAKLIFDFVTKNQDVVQTNLKKRAK